MDKEKEYEANCAMSTIINTAENLKFWVKEKNYGEMPSLLETMNRGVSAMNAMLAMSGEPELIQGYTEEQWQEIIGGGYLVDVADREGDFWLPSRLIKIDEDNLFVTRAGNHEETNWVKCRPAQIKGVMRPVFVEPKNEGATCVFFNYHGEALTGNGGTFTYSYVIRTDRFPDATSYIEV